MTEARYTPSGTFPDLDGSAGDGPLFLQQDGDVFSAELSIKSTDAAKGVLAKLINACDWLKKNVGAAVLAAAHAWTGANTFDDVTVTATHDYKLSSRSVDRTQSMPLVNRTTGAVAYGLPVTAAVGNSFEQGLALAHGGTLTALRWTVDPDNHASISGMNMPSLTLRKFEPATGATTNIGSATDTSVNSSSYSAQHDIVISALSEVIDRTRFVYYVIYTHESGSNSASGQVLGATTTQTITKVDPTP